MVLLSGLESNGCTKKCFTNTQFHQQVLQLVRKLRMKLVIWSNAFLLIGKTKKLTWSLSLVELVTLKVRLDMLTTLMYWFVLLKYTQREPQDRKSTRLNSSHV